MNAATKLELIHPPVANGTHASVSSDAALLAQMIHDLKNPLSAVLCYAEIVPDAKDDERREYCDRLQANARAVLDMLDGFGLLASLRSGDVDTTIETFDWVRQAMRIATDLQPVATFRAQRIACETEGELLIAGDRSKLSVAMRNLTVEALRVASPNTTVELHVRAVGEATLEVCVPGDRGIDPALLFDPRRPALELVSRVAALHDGELVFRAAAGRAVATLRLPV